MDIPKSIGILETDYGDLNYRKGDYLVIPRGTTYRFVTQEPNIHWVIESRDEIIFDEVLFYHAGNFFS